MHKLAGSHCCVTGGAGFVGSSIVDQLIDAGAVEIRIIDNFVGGSWNNLAWALEQPGVSVIEGDIRDRDRSFERAIDGMGTCVSPGSVAHHPMRRSAA